MVRTRFIPYFFVALGLSSCGGGNNSKTQPENDPPVDYSKLTESGVQPTQLKTANESELEQHLKNGIRLDAQLTYSLPSPESINTMTDASIGNADVRFAEAATTSEYSQTNTHEVNVDEADFVKYDGKYIYSVSHPEYIWGEDRPNAKIGIVETHPESATTTAITEIPLNNSGWGEVSQLYLVDAEDKPADALTTLRSSWSIIATSEPDISEPFIDIWAPVADKIQLLTYDLSNPALPEIDWTVEIDGYLQNSRKVGDILYLVTDFTPQLYGIEYFADEATKLRNEKIIGETALADLLPKISINGGAATLLFDPDTCLIPKDTTDNHGFKQLISVVALDLSKRELASSTCLNTSVHGIHSTTEALFLAKSDYGNWGSGDSHTTIHKLELTSTGANYRSTGIVNGTLGRGDPAFRMNHHQGYLRIVTTKRTSNTLDHTLTILQDSPDSDEMQVVSELPNETSPDPIGKPGEDIYAVRFYGNKAYIVTYQQTDPLYTLNLSDAENPIIVGALEITGVSQYLHPVGENHLLGVGRDGDTGGNLSGIKISLFDTSDFQNPQEVNSISIGSRRSWSEALYDPRAISFLTKSSDQLRFTLPVSRYSESHAWQDQSLHMFEINGLNSNTASLDANGFIIGEEASETQEWPLRHGTDRSVLHDDAVFYIHGNEVISRFWGAP